MVKRTRETINDLLNKPDPQKVYYSGDHIIVILSNGIIVDKQAGVKEQDYFKKVVPLNQSFFDKNSGRLELGRGLTLDAMFVRDAEQQGHKSGEEKYILCLETPEGGGDCRCYKVDDVQKVDNEFELLQQSRNYFKSRRLKAS